MRFHKWVIPPLACAIVALSGSLPWAAPVHAATFTVNSALDEARNPAAPAGVCQSTPSGLCTLPGGPPYVLTLGTLTITSDVTINGAGAASTIIDGGATAGVLSLSTPNIL